MLKNENASSALTVAGSDSGGGAGVQADLRTFTSLGVFGTSAITAITSQNPLGVTRVDAVPVEGVKAQIEAVLSEIPVAAIKTGMLYGAQTVAAVAELLEGVKAPLIVDPVAVATSGAQLLKPAAVKELRSKLLPQAAWATPNIPETELLAKLKIRSESDMIDAAYKCYELWGCACVIKGGHFKGDALRSSDIVCAEGEIHRLSSPRAPVTRHSDHGTGCTFSAAFAALLARGEPWRKALVGAKAFVLASLVEPVQLSPKIFAMFPPDPSGFAVEDVVLERLK